MLTPKARLERANKLQAKAEQIRHEVDAENRTVSETLVKTLTWTYTVYMTDINSSFERNADPDSFRITATLDEASIQALSNHRTMYGTFNAWDFDPADRHSVCYYRTRQNVMLHSGGGYLLLEDGILVDDATWERLKRGEFIASDFKTSKGF